MLTVDENKLQKFDISHGIVSAASLTLPELQKFTGACWNAPSTVLTASDANVTIFDLKSMKYVHCVHCR